MLHRIRYVPTGEYSGELYIDEKKVKADAADVSLRAGEIPRVEVRLLGQPEMDLQAEIGLTDEEVIGMVRRRVKDSEFLKQLMWMIRDEYRI